MLAMEVVSSVFQTQSRREHSCHVRDRGWEWNGWCCGRHFAWPRLAGEISQLILRLAVRERPNSSSSLQPADSDFHKLGYGELPFEVLP